MTRIVDDERLIKLLENLREFSEKGVPIIVEGQKDELVLRNLGICGSIIKVGAYGPLKTADFLFSSENMPNSVIILTDFDKNGENLARILEDLLRAYGITPINEFRKELKKLTGGRMKSIEELLYFVELSLENKRRRYNDE